MSLSPLKEHGMAGLTKRGQNDALYRNDGLYDGISGALGVGRDHRDGRHSAIKPRTRPVENEPDILDGFGVQRRSKRGDDTRICTLHYRRLALCIPVLFVLYQYRNLYVVGGVHSRAQLVCVIPLLPFIHPRMASEHHGVTNLRQLEPPGFLAMNYGYQTPIATLVAQAAYGGVLGACVQIQHAMMG
jgi:hypothetical protein